MSKTFNLFISHSWTYGNEYDRLINLLSEKKYFDFKNYSVPKNDPIHSASNQTELYEAIKKQISPCHLVIILAGVYASYSKWIDKEITIAKKEFTIPKPLLAIKPFGNDKVSLSASEKADQLVNWNTESIVAAIRDLCK